MKIKALANLMNDHGTNPRVRVIKHTVDGALLYYEGKPQSMDEETAELKVNSFTVLGKGVLEIHAR